jgi:enterochelin esterase-like enzyme
MKKVTILTIATVAALSFGSLALSAQKKKGDKQPVVFSWNNPPQKWTLGDLPPNLSHASFKSPSMGLKVGYYVYLPNGYDKPNSKKRKYPVVYHLHGGRPGLEKKSIALATFIHQAMKGGLIQPAIYVFPNGGPMSWYNYPQKENGRGEDVFVKELIPHVDATYRTDGTRAQRGLQGFSQGGRGTTRIMFKYPELFGSTAPGGSGYEPEEKIRDNAGEESKSVKFAKGYDAWTLAQKYSKRRNAPPLKPMIWVGTKGFNYEYNLKYMKYLDQLGIPYEKLVVPDAPHSAKLIYEKKGLELMQFHDRNFGQ